VDWSNQELLLNSQLDFFSNVKIFSFEVQVSKLWGLRKNDFNERSLNEFLKPQSLFLFKHQEQVEMRELSNIQYHLLKILMNKKTFFDAIEDLGDQLDIDPQEVQDLLKKQLMLLQIYLNKIFHVIHLVFD
jgi:hypothetical protein